MTKDKMEFDGHYAVMEVSFILNDSRLDALTPTQRWLYIVLWCRAVQLKQGTIPFYSALTTSKSTDNSTDSNLKSTKDSTASLARLSRIDPRSTAAAITKLQQLRLINVEVNGDITVCGVKKKHPKLKWKRNKLNSVKSKLAPIYVENTDTDTEKIRKRKKEEKEKELLHLSHLKIRKSYFEELCKEFPTVDHQEELKCANLHRESKPGKGKGNDHLFLRNWFKNAIKFKEKNGGKRIEDLSKYDNI